MLFYSDALYIMHLSHLKRTIPRNQTHRIQKEHNQNFDSWFKDYISNKYNNNVCTIHL